MLKNEKHAPIRRSKSGGLIKLFGKFDEQPTKTFVETSMNKEPISIPTLGLQHFCIKDKDPIEILKQEYIIVNLSDIQVVNKINWDFIYNEDEESKNFILLTDLNGWSYFLWKYWDFNTNLDLAKKLSKALNTKVNYYFVDSHIATSRWILTEGGLVTRAYYESHGQKLVDEGFNQTEKDLRANGRETYVEDLFWELYEKTCLSLESVNSQNRTEFKLRTGTLGNRTKTTS